MAAGQLDPHRDAIESGMQRRRNRADRFRQHRARPTMQQAVGLPITRDWHRRNDLPRPHGLKCNAHPLGKFPQRDLILVVRRHGNSLRGNSTYDRSVSETKLLLLDGHSLAYRAFYALPVENFMTSTGQPTNAVYGFMSMLLSVLSAERPTHVAVAFDVSRQTFRTELYPEYKAQRESSPAEFKGQVALIEDVLDAMGIRVIALPGFEADDVIATLADQAQAERTDVSIVTGDRDTFQLITDHITVLYPRKGVSDLARMTPTAVLDRYGVTPEQYADYAAMRGDPSDNLPGVPGVGEKTAAKWLTEYGDLTSLIEHSPALGGKVGESFRAHLPQVLLNRSLTQLRTDAPIHTPWQECDWRDFDHKKLDEILDALQFTALRDRLQALRPKSAVAVEKRVVTAAESVSVARLAEFLDPGPWVVAVAGQVRQGRGTIDALGFTRNGDEVYTVNAADIDWNGPIGRWFADPAAHKVLHGAKSTAVALRSVGVELRGVSFDTALADYLIEPGQRSYQLADVAQRLIGITLGSAGDQLVLDPGEVEIGNQASAIWECWQVLVPRVQDAGAEALLVDIEIPTSLVLAQMEYLGIRLDIEQLKALSAELASDMAAAERQAHELVGHPFNIGSPKQLQAILFDERGLPKTKKIKTGYTTDAEALQTLFAATGDPLLEQILRFRDRSKLRQTVDGLLPLADAEHRVHTTFHQTAAATGRLSSSDPNLQNIPVRTATGRRIRACFIADPAAEGLLTADYSQIEMRIMAHVSDDAGLIAAFRAGEDLHTTVGASVFGVSPSDVTADMRRQVKAMSYGLAYGLSAFGLSQQLDIGVDAARALMDEYFDRFGGVRDYLRRTVEGARTTGYTETLMGRRRYLPDLRSDNRQRRDMAERMALNAPIQGSAADIVKIAMLRVHEALAAKDLRSALLLQVHDELVLEVAPGERAEVESIVVSAMESAVSLAVPLQVSLGFGASWDAAAH